MATIGITMGCPVGIGPEIILRFFENRKTPAPDNVFVIGDHRVLEKCGSELGLPVHFHPYSPGDRPPAGVIPVLDVSQLPASQLTWGEPTRQTGKAMAEYIIRAVQLAQAKAVDAIVTGPISKSALNNAGFMFPGHTEMLAHLTAAPEHAMMLAGPKLKVTLVTIHSALRDVPNLLTTTKIEHLITLTDTSLRRDFGKRSPKIAVAGLNPHAGEDGLFGDEETRFIAPAIESCQNKQINVTGPYPPDTVFYKAAAGQFDAVVCMYHDQGLIPFKLLHFDDGVNVTLGLPIVRTSVDHGTAYDIAGKGKASASSLKSAVELAATIAHNRALIHA